MPLITTGNTSIGAGNQTASTLEDSHCTEFLAQRARHLKAIGLNLGCQKCPISAQLRPDAA